jgi:hypothetical protein
MKPILTHIFCRSAAWTVMFVLFFTLTLKAQNPSLRNAAPLPNTDSTFMVRLDFRYGEGLQLGNPPRITLPSARVAMQQFGITDSDVSAFMPGFNQADTIMYHPDGYSYRVQNYAHSVVIKCQQASRKTELMNVFATVPEIHTVRELPRPQPR